MSDRTNFQLYLYDVPEAEHSKVLNIINECALDTEWFSTRKNVERIELGENYVDDGAAGDMADEVGTALVAVAPGATFVCWTDPAYEWLGSVWMHTPELGTYTAECDANGIPAISNDTLLEAIRKLPETASRDDVLAAIDKLSGGPWLRAMSAAAETVAHSEEAS